jgi:hypothetical protein
MTRTLRTLFAASLLLAAGCDCSLGARNTDCYPPLRAPRWSPYVAAPDEAVADARRKESACADNGGRCCPDQ